MDWLAASVIFILPLVGNALHGAAIGFPGWAVNTVLFFFLGSMGFAFLLAVIRGLPRWSFSYLGFALTIFVFYGRRRGSPPSMAPVLICIYTNSQYWGLVLPAKFQLDRARAVDWYQFHRRCGSDDHSLSDLGLACVLWVTTSRKLERQSWRSPNRCTVLAADPILTCANRLDPSHNFPQDREPMKLIHTR